jgi:general secretion pathway protein K
MSFQVKLLSRSNPNYSSQRGTAIIIALFVMAIAAAASIAMVTRLHVDIRRTEILLNYNQADLYAQGSVAWAIDKLNADWRQQNPDQLVDKIPITSPVDTVNGFKIQSIIYDAQANYNLNNLVTVNNQYDFLHLLRMVAPQMEVPQATQITMAVHDWVSPANNAEFTTYYAGLNPGYKAPHRQMVSVSELRLVRGMTADIYNKLLPYVTVLPTTTGINVNTAQPLALTSLSPLLTLETARALATMRQQAPFLNTDKFQSQDVVKNGHVTAAKITTVSNYFLVKTQVSIGQQQTILYTLLTRTTQGPKSQVTVLWQMKGTL